MHATPETVPGIGHNRPPEPTPFETLNAEANERIDVANRWLTERPTIANDEMADRAGGFKRQLAETRKALDGARRGEKAPLEQQLKAIDARYRPLLDLLDRATDMITRRISAYLQRRQHEADEQRRQQEAEARRQREAAEAAARRAVEEAQRTGGDALRAQQQAEEARRQAEAAEKAAAERTRAAIKGEFTSRAMTLRTTWHARVIDPIAALRHYGKHPLVREAALEAALKLAEAKARVDKRADTAPPGFAFFEEQRAA